VNYPAVNAEIPSPVGSRTSVLPLGVGAAWASWLRAAQTMGRRSVVNCIGCLVREEAFREVGD
jgi:hypothetical protein